MSSVSIRYLELFNFRSFRGKHRIEFPETGLLNLRGISGAGKTNVLLAIAFVFRYCRLPAKALQCWADEEGFYVECGLSTGDVVRRGAGGVSIGKLRGTTAEDRLDRICGVDKKLRELLTYKDQVAPKRVLSMEDKQLKEFLVQVLGIEKLDEAIAQAKESWERGEAEVARLRERAASAQQEHERLRDSITPPQLEDVERLRAVAAVAVEWWKQVSESERIDREHLWAAEQAANYAATRIIEQWEYTARQLEGRAAECRNEPLPEVDRSSCAPIEMDIVKCKDFISDLQAQDEAASATYEAGTNALRKEARRLHNELAKVVHLADDAGRLNGEVKSLQHDVCSTCERPWENAKVRLAEKLAELAVVEKTLAEVQAHRPRALALDAEVAGRAFVHDKRLLKLRDVLVQLGERLAVEDEKAWAACRAAQSSIEHRAAGYERDARVARVSARAEAQERVTGDVGLKDLRARLESSAASVRSACEQKNRLETDLRVAEAKNEAAESAHRRSQEALVAASQRYTDAASECTLQEVQVKAEADYLALLTGFRNKIFDETLAAIGAEASQILLGLPNAQHITVDFASERTTGRGTVQERVVPIVYLDGIRRTLGEAVSGGQMTSVSLAVDLATARVVSRRLGCYLNWMILDEAFGGHSPETKLACVEMLREYAADKLVIVVDHDSEVKEALDRVVTVTMEGKASILS